MFPTHTQLRYRTAAHLSLLLVLLLFLTACGQAGPSGERLQGVRKYAPRNMNVDLSFALQYDTSSKVPFAKTYTLYIQNNGTEDLYDCRLTINGMYTAPLNHLKVASLFGMTRKYGKNSISVGYPAKFPFTQKVDNFSAFTNAAGLTLPATAFPYQIRLTTKDSIQEWWFEDTISRGQTY